MTHVQNWCNNFHLKLNDKKTKILFISNGFVREPCPPTFNLDNYVVDNLNFLGFHINSSLTWNQHINIIIKSASSRLHILRLLKKTLTKQHLINLYYAFIQTLFNYSFPIHSHITIKELNKITSIKHRAHRIICGTDCKDNCLPSFQDCSQVISSSLFNKIALNPQHILHCKLPNRSPRSKRFILPHISSNNYLNSFFIKYSIKFNQQFN